MDNEHLAINLLAAMENKFFREDGCQDQASLSRGCATRSSLSTSTGQVQPRESDPLAAAALALGASKIDLGLDVRHHLITVNGHGRVGTT